MSDAGAERVERRWGRWRWLVFAAVLVGVIVGAALWRRATDVEAAVEAAGGRVLWDNQPNVAQKLAARLMDWPTPGTVGLTLADTDIDDDWIEKHRDGIGRIAGNVQLELTNTAISDVALSHLRGLKNIELLNVSRTGITDTGLDHVLTLVNLEQLLVEHTHVSDDGLGRLSSSPKLWFLGVDRSQLTERGVAHLKRSGIRWLTLRDAADEAVARLADVTQLERLYLDGAGVTDASVPVLSGMTQLESIIFVDDSLSDAGYESLQEALPNCMMTRLTGAEARGEE